MDANFVNPQFSTPSFNVNSWGDVTNNFGQRIGSVDRFGSFRDNLHPNFSCQVDNLGRINNGFDRSSAPIGQLRGYDYYQSAVRMRDTYNNDLFTHDRNKWDNKSKYSWEIGYSKPDPIIPIVPKYPKIDPILPMFPEKKSYLKEDNYLNDSLFPNRKKSSGLYDLKENNYINDLSYKVKDYSVPGYQIPKVSLLTRDNDESVPYYKTWNKFL